MIVEATAPGKMILFGEHSVVYGAPAIVLAIDRRAKVHSRKRKDNKIFINADDLGFSGYFENDVYHAVRGQAWRGRNLTALNIASKKTMEKLDIKSGLDLKVRSMIPIAAGLGSSAAVCVATVAAVDKLFEGNLKKDQISKLAFEGEKIIHGSPSGVDNNISTFGGVLRFQKKDGIQRFKLKEPIQFIIGHSRRKRSTRKMVENVAHLREKNIEIVDKIIQNMGLVADQGLEALIKHDIHRLGNLMNINQGLLASLGVSTMKLETLIHTARKNGAIGAKLTGAGGGGCIIALAEEKNIPKIEKAIRRRKSDSMWVNLTYKGVEAKWVEEDGDP